MLGSWTFTVAVTAALVATVTSLCPGDPGNPIPKECPLINSMTETVHLAHEWDCTKFYKCDWGNRVLFDCPMMNAKKRLHFNPSLQVCDWPQCAGCNSTNWVRVPYPGDCTKYEEIINGQNFPRDCLPGLHFSPTKKECMRPEDAGCQLPPNPCNGVVNGLPVAHGSDCEKYYWCNDGNPSLQHCQKGMHFSKTLHSCAKPEIACCNYRALEIYPGDCTKYYENVNCQKTTMNCPYGFHFSPTKKECMRPEDAGCQRLHGPCDGVNEGSLVAHETDCNKYYMCNNAYPSPRQCDEGLHFSKTLQRCVEPKAACCNYKALEPYPGVCTKYYEIVNCQKTIKDCQDGLQFSPTMKSCMAPQDAGCQLPPGPCDGAINGLPVAHRTDCEKYYECNNGKPSLQHCQEGMHFSKTLHSCAKPEIACCNYTALETYPGDCTKYYENVNCQKTTVNCPYGLHFSPTEKKCELPEDAGCQQSPEPCYGFANGTSVDYVCDCSKYILCLNGYSILKNCQPGLDYSNTLHKCVEPDVAGCNVTAVEPYPGNCAKYYAIVGGKKIEKNCPSGMHFSSMGKKCVPPSEAKCECEGGIAYGGKIAMKCDSTVYFLCDGGELVRKLCPKGLHFNDALKYCIAPEITT